MVDAPLSLNFREPTVKHRVRIPGHVQIPNPTPPVRAGLADARISTLITDPLDLDSRSASKVGVSWRVPGTE